MSNVFTAKQLGGPTLFDAMQEQLRQYGESQKATNDVAPPPTSATEFTDRIANEVVNIPQRQLKAMTPQPTAVPGVRVRDVLPLAIPGVGPAIDLGSRALNYLGTLSPERSQELTERKAEDEREQEAAIQSKAETRARLRGLTDQQAAEMGLPVAPGGSDFQAQTESAINDANTVREAGAQRETAEAATQGKAPPITQEWWLNAMQVGAREAARTGIGALKFPTIVYEGIRDAAIRGEGGTSYARGWLDDVDKMMTDILPGDKARSKEFLTQLASGAGSMAAFMTAGYVGSMMKLPALLSTGGLGAAVSGTTMFEEAEDFGADAYQKYLSFILGAGIGLTEAIPIDRMFMRADIATGGLIRRLLKNAGASALDEFIQEASQSLGEDIVAKYLAGFDPDREIDGREILKQGLIGALTGGVAGAATTGARQEQQAEEQVDPAEQERIASAAVEQAQILIDDILGPDRNEGPLPAFGPGTDVAEAADTETAVAPSLAPAVAAETGGFRVGDTLAQLATDERGAPSIQLVPAPQLQQAPTFRGGTPPQAREDGRVELYHWSAAPLGAIDPAKRGTGPLRGAERERLGPQGNADPNVVDRSYYGVGDPDFVQKRENDRVRLRQMEYDRRLSRKNRGDAEGGGEAFDAQIRELRKRVKQPLEPTSPYQREGLGPYRHVVTVDPNDIYNMLEDPLGLRAQLDPDAPSSERITQYERLVRDAGFKGYWMQSSQLGQTAALFDPQQPERVLDERTGEEIVPEPNDIAAMLSPERQIDLSLEVPGFGRVAPYLTPTERKRLRKSTAKKLLDIFDTMPPPEEMAAVAISGQAKRGWYARSAKALLDIFGIEDAPRFAGLLAALSPQTSVDTNAINTLRTWIAWDKAGRPSDPKKIEKLLTNVIGLGNRGSVLDAWVNNSVTALSTPDATEIQLSGPKVDSFMRNLLGNTIEVTNDAWMANYANVEQSLFKASYLRTPDGAMRGEKGPGYMAMSAAVRRAAEIASDVTDDVWTPSEIQETVWSWAKTLYEKSGSQTAVDLLELGGLTAEDIANTPDFAGLFSSGVYRTILEKGGYGEQLTEAGSGRPAEPSGAPRSVTSAEGTAFDQGAFEQHLRTAAERLDARRQERLGDRQPVTYDDIGDTFAMLSDTEQATPDAFKYALADALQMSGWAILTGTKEANGPASSPENVAANDKLRAELGNTAVEIGGVYQGVDQGPSFIVFADLKKALELGRRYGQESILTRDGLIYGDGRFVPAVPQDTVVGDEARERDFFSSMPDGEAFSVGLDFDAMSTPQTATPEFKASVNNRGAFDPNNPDILASKTPIGTSAGRETYKAEQTRPAGGIPLQPGAEQNDINLTKISRNFIRLLDLTVRQGRLTAAGGARVMGQYNRRQAVARLRSMDDLSTLVHEGGHALFDMQGDLIKNFAAANERQLMDVANKLYGQGLIDTAKLNRGDHVREGFSELLRVYTLNRAYAVREFPQLTADFDALLRTEAPQIAAGLDAVGRQFAAFLQLPSATVFRNMVVSGQRESGISEAMKELREVGFKSWMSEYARRTVGASFNRYAALNKVVTGILNIGEENRGGPIDLKRAQDPRTLIRLAANAGARATVQLSDGIMAYQSTEPHTRSLREAVLVSQGVPVDSTPAGLDEARYQDFIGYIVARRTLDEYRRLDEGKLDRPPVGASLDDARRAVTDYEGKYGEAFTKAADIVHEFGMAMWQKQFDAGLMSKDVYQKGLDRQFYAPLQRDMSDKARDFMPSAVTNGRSLVKKLKGSDRNVVDPIAILMHKLYTLEQTIAQNDVAKALAALADRAGAAGALVERVAATKVIGQTLSVLDAAKAITKDPLITEMDAQDLMTILAASIKDGNYISLFRREQASTMGENIVFFWENGTVQALQLQDGDVGADVMNTLNAVGRENMSLGVELIAGTSSVFRSMITKWPDFLIVNYIRDQMSAWILSDVGYKPFVSGVRGMAEEVRQKTWARKANAAMMTMGGMNIATMHQARVDRDVNALRAKGYVAKVFSDRTARGAAQGFARITELSETGTRLGLFKNAYERAKRDGLTDWEASIEAAYTATDYIDFGLNGSRMLMWRRVIPFLNAQLQGYYKMMRTLGGDEVRQRKGLKFVLAAYFKSTKNMPLSRTEKLAINTGRKAWLKMASLGLISALLHFMFRDDEDYQEAGEYLRTTHWVIPLGGGRILSIAKPFELALIANAVERGLEHASGDKEAVNRFMRGAAMTMVPPTSPPALQVLIEYAANKNFFTGQEIVPDYMAALAPELQYNNYTSPLAKKVGEITGWSPMVVDHFMAGLGASAYRDTMSITNSLDPNRPSMDVTDAPIARRFVRDIRRGSASSRDFWAQASMLDGRLRRAETSYKRYLEGGNVAAADRFLSTVSEDERGYALLATHFKAEYKRLNPFYRARQVTTIVAAMRREMVSELGLENTYKFADTPSIQLTAGEKGEVDELLSELARREMRNTLVATGMPGWDSSKKPLDTQKTIDMIAGLAPDVGEELQRRLDKAKVYDAAAVFEGWPEARKRLIEDREEAYLDDLVSVAKVPQ